MHIKYWIFLQPILFASDFSLKVQPRKIKKERIYSFPNFEPVSCSMSSSNCCFLTCLQVSWEKGKVVWYWHLFQKFPQLVVIHTVKGFSVVNEAEVDVFFWNSPTFSIIQWMLAIWSLIYLSFLNPVCPFGSSRFMDCWSLACSILSITLLVCKMSTVVWQFEPSLALPFLEFLPGESHGQRRQAGYGP